MEMEHDSEIAQLFTLSLFLLLIILDTVSINKPDKPNPKSAMLIKRNPKLFHWMKEKILISVTSNSNAESERRKML